MQRYNKAIAAFVGSGVSLAVMLGLMPAGTLSPELIGGISTVVAAALTWLVPNRP